MSREHTPLEARLSVLLAGVNRQNRDDANALCTELYLACQGFALRLTHGDEQAADEILKDAIRDIVLHSAKIRHFVLRATRKAVLHKFIDRLRKRKFETPLPDDQLVSMSDKDVMVFPGLIDYSLTLEEMEKIHAVFDCLGPRDREIMKYVCNTNMTQEQIVKQLKSQHNIIVNENSIKTFVVRARAKLQQKLIADLGRGRLKILLASVRGGKK